MFDSTTRNGIGLSRPVKEGVVAALLGLALGIYVVTVLSFPVKVMPLLVIAVLFPFAVVIVGDLRRVFLALILMDVPFHFDVNLWYRPDIAKLGAVGGLNLSLSTISLVVLYSLWFGQAVLGQSSRPRPRLRQSLPLTVYTGVAALAMFVAHDRELSVFQLFLLIQELLLFTYIASAVRTKPDVVFVVIVLLLGVALEGALIGGLKFTGFELSIVGMSTEVDESYRQSARLGGTLGSPNNASAYFAILLPIAMSVLLAKVERWQHWLAVFAFSLGGCALIFTLSRGGWGAFAVGAFIFCWVTWRRGQLPISVPLVLGVVGLLLFFVFQDAIVSRLTENDQGAAYSRIPLMYVALRMIADNPLLGVGPNNFAFRMGEYVPAELATAWLYTVHNKFLLLWAEIGPAGLAAFLWFLFSTLRRGWQCCQCGDPLLTPLALGLTAAIAGHMTHMVAEAFNGRPLTNLLGICAGLLMALFTIAKQERENVHRHVQQQERRGDYA
ncbi:MAG: O-antigen ligase family protein [Candidatus Binatia bacterium]